MGETSDYEKCVLAIENVSLDIACFSNAIGKKLNGRDVSYINTSYKNEIIIDTEKFLIKLNYLSLTLEKVQDIQLLSNASRILIDFKNTFSEVEKANELALRLLFPMVDKTISKIERSIKGNSLLANNNISNSELMDQMILRSRNENNFIDFLLITKIYSQLKILKLWHNPNNCNSLRCFLKIVLIILIVQS